MEQELRAVVLGWQKSDKASVINSILGDKPESDAYFVKSVKRDGEVNGRKITLINTPCWWEVFDSQDSPEVVKQELVCSVFLCEPGPHVFLLVINLSLPFTEDNRVSVEKHLELFGERIWRHTVVIFTADSLKHKPIEQHALNPELQEIVQKCGERHLVFENENKSAGVEELLIKIDALVTANNNEHFETRDDTLLDVQRKRNEIKKRAKSRRETVQNKRKPLKDIKAVAPLSEVRIVLLGWIMSGKTSAVNTIFNNENIENGGTEKYPQYSGDVNGRSVTVLDTPSWWKYFTPKFNPKSAQTAILKSVGQSELMKYPHAMILVIPADTSFRNEQKRIIQEYMATLGDDVWRHAIVLFTWGDRFPDVSIEQHIEAEGEALQWLIEKCRNRYHVFDNTDKNQDQVTELLQKIDEMVAENSLFRLNTECAAEVNVRDADTQRDEEITLSSDELIKLMYKELKNRRKEIKMKPKDVETEVTGCTEARSNASIQGTIDFKVDKKVLEQIKREVSRLEAILTDRILNIKDPEAFCGDYMSANEKVFLWLQKYEEYSKSETSGYITAENDSEMSDSTEIKPAADRPRRSVSW